MEEKVTGVKRLTEEKRREEQDECSLNTSQEK
jgi:hypothetical protein